MNAVEIEEAISALAERPFDAAEFPYAFLEAFGNKETTLKRLRSGASNKSDVGGVLQTNNIHIATCQSGAVTNTLALLKASPATARAKARFVLATDGDLFEAEDLTSDDAPISCAYGDFPNHFGFFLPLAGITTVKQVRESSFDIRATSRLNKLYVELLKDNPAWGTASRRPDMNHFMARLIFCFFCRGYRHLRRQRHVHRSHRSDERQGLLEHARGHQHAVPRHEHQGGGSCEGRHSALGRPLPLCERRPVFRKHGRAAVQPLARSFLLHIGGLDWKKINPDIFGSMIQAVADEDERGALGMHYTSVPNILKVLNPLFLDELRERLEEAGDNARMLLNLRKRMSKIRVFDPACGSGNFLVIAYKEMRAIEAEINRRRDEADRRTEIPLTNFRGIELRDFPAEIARLALIIAEYQCDVLYRGQKEALQDFLPLDAQNWITCGNALWLDWLSICPPAGTGVKHHADDLFHTPLKQAQIDFDNEGGETYVCGNPPYLGGKKQNESQKYEMKKVADGRYNHLNLDYICAFFTKAIDSLVHFRRVAFVTTASLNQGFHVPTFWPFAIKSGAAIDFCYEYLSGRTMRVNNAGVYCTIIGLSASSGTRACHIYFDGGKTRGVPYKSLLISGNNDIVESRSISISGLSKINTVIKLQMGELYYLQQLKRTKM